MNEEIKEEWRDVVGYEGLYQVSNTGKVRNTTKNFELKQSNHYGYKCVHLFHNGISKLIFVHRLVAFAFIPNYENKPCIDHIDGTRFNNNVLNLRWVTHLENIRNPITLKKAIERTRETHTTKEFREKISKTRSVDFWEKYKNSYEKVWKDNSERDIRWKGKEILCVETGQIFSSARALAKILKVNHTIIPRYCRGEVLCAKSIISMDGSVIINRPHFIYMYPDEYLEERKKNACTVAGKRLRCIENNYEIESIHALSRIIGVSPSTASSYCTGKTLCKKEITFDDGTIIKNPHFEFVNKEKENENV